MTEKLAFCTQNILSGNARFTGTSHRAGDVTQGTLSIYGRSGAELHFRGNPDGSAEAVAVARGMEGVYAVNPAGETVTDTTANVPNPKAAEFARNAVKGFNRCMHTR